MPNLFSELSPSFSRSAEEGKLTDTRTRSFRVLLSSPGEIFNPQAFIGIYIGQPHPWSADAYCVGVRCEFEGESRMTALAHFDYKQATGKEDNKNQEPSVRPANLSTDTTTVEMPTTRWWDYETNAREVAKNPAGDMYDGISHLVPSTAITLEQYEATDPTRHGEYAGYVNDRPITIGSLTCEKHSLMFRGVSMRPHVEAFGDDFWRGWLASYQFLYRYNEQEWHTADSDGGNVSTSSGNAGWDSVVPLSGFNIINTKHANTEDGALNLEIEEGAKRIKGWTAQTHQVAPGTGGKKMRAMVLVASPEPDGNSSAYQRPSAQPVPLNPDGTPRKSTLAVPVLMFRYRTQPSTDFARFNLRLY